MVCTSPNFTLFSKLTATKGNASDAVRDQVMRHDPFTGVFNGAYINHTVRFNVQDAFLESDISDDGLTRAFTHMSIRRNPGAPKDVPEKVMEPLLAADPDISDLKRRCKDLFAEIKCQHKFINQAPKDIRTAYTSVRNELKNATKSFKDEIRDVFRKDYHFRIHNEMMKMQLQRQRNPIMAEKDDENVEPLVEHQLEERARVQQILCDFSKDLSSQVILARKVLAIDSMTALASRREFQSRTRRSAPTYQQPPLKQESPAPAPDPFLPRDEFPLVCKKTQCIICIGNELYSHKDRTRSFRRVSHMMDHVENVHLKGRAANERYICEHPICKSEGLVLNNVNHFKNHVATVHGILLREPRYVG
jgi:hypothetical protein